RDDQAHGLPGPAGDRAPAVRHEHRCISSAPPRWSTALSRDYLVMLKANAYVMMLFEMSRCGVAVTRTGRSANWDELRNRCINLGSNDHTTRARAPAQPCTRRPGAGAPASDARGRFRLARGW